MTILVEAKDNRFVINAPGIMKDMVRKVPGMRWNRANQDWRGPLSWSTALAARAVFGGQLELSPTAIEWGSAEVSRIATSQAVKDRPWPNHEYGYQDIGAEWLRATGRCVLGDDPGLGKTRQAILALEAPALIVTINTAKLNWAVEIGLWRPELRVVVLTGTAAHRVKQMGRGDWDVAVTNWDNIRTQSRLAPYGSIALTDKEKIPGPLNRPWATLVPDEIHAAKDPKSKQTRAFWAIAESAERVYGLTGTISPENPGNVWAIMHGICPEEYPSSTQFIDRYMETIIPFWGGMDIVGLDPATRDEFFQIFDPRFLRRTKAQALPQLPPKRYSVRYLAMEPKQRKAYVDLEDKFLTRTEGGVLATTGQLPNHVRLLQAASATPTLDGYGNVVLIAPSNKVNGLLELISESPNEPIAVFSPSKKLIDLAAQALTKAKITFSLITGDQKGPDRQKSIDDFQSGAVQVVLGTCQAGGTGINLFRAQRLVFLSRPEASVQSIQTEGRVDRIGQTGGDRGYVEIIDLVSWDTVEHDVHDHLVSKGMLANQINRDADFLRRVVEQRPKRTDFGTA